MTEAIKLAQIKEVATRVVAANPDAINPTNGTGGGCLYMKLSDDETPNAAEHCLGGTVLLELSLALPNEGRPAHLTTDADRLTATASGYLRNLQTNADNHRMGNRSNPRTWSEALTLTNANYK